MKSRIRKIATFFAFNVLFFALYLNLFHKEKKTDVNPTSSSQQVPAAFDGNMLAKNP